MAVICGNCKEPMTDDDFCKKCHSPDLQKEILGDSDKLLDDFYDREKYPNKLRNYDKQIQRESVR